MASLVQKNDTLAMQYPETYVAKDYYAIAGTSQSAAVVSGIAALTLAEHPELTPDQVKYRIMYSSEVWIDLDFDGRPLQHVAARSRTGIRPRGCLR